MSILLSEVHFWTIQEDVITKYNDYGSFKYFTKKDSQDSINYQTKKTYCEQRGTVWMITNKRQNKLKDKLRELEDCLIQSKIISFLWKDNELQLLLSTGLLAHINVNPSTGDISSIHFDKQLSTKLQVNIICDGVILGSQVICICNDGHVLGHGGLWKDGWLLEGGPRRRLDCHGEWLAVWGKVSSEQPQPWSPLAKDHQRANLHLYWVGARGPDLLAYKNSDGEPLSFTVSKVCDGTVILVEQKVTQRGVVSVEISSLELSGTTLKTVSITSVPLQTQVSCCALSYSEDYLFIGCIDGTIALLDRHKGSTKIVKSSFIPTLCTWQRKCVLIAICNERGQLQYYDTALNCVKSQIVSEDSVPLTTLDLAGYFNSQFSVVSIDWGSKDLIIALEQGPIVLISHEKNSLSFDSLAKRYISLEKIDKVVSLLLSRKFSEETYYVLQKIVTLLLKRPLTEEIAENLQNALGCYHGPSVPLSSEMKHQFGNQVFCLTRRFFHQLVRHEMYETAFLLAVDVGHHDLFMDLHYIAVKIGETEMAAAARAQAFALMSRCSSDASNCSHSSCSQCSSSESEEDETQTNKEKIQKKTIDKNQNDSIQSQKDNNLLSTNFNQELQKSYSLINLYDYVTNSEFPKLASTPRATFVKSPQVPAHYTSRFASPTKPEQAWPTFSTPLPSLLSSNLGIPLMQSTNCLTSPSYSINSSTPNLSNPTCTNNIYKSPIPSVGRIPTTNISKSNFTQTKPLVAPPPLPTVPFSNVASTTSNIIAVSSALSISKKPQPKVKFSDTVTAFIVPEIKRPVRVPPPPHMTDPQKELADSLPLCHPNEDYLKDFTPVRRHENEATSTSQPKIKVVHFGVV